MFLFQTGDDALRQNCRSRNKIVKHPFVFIVFSEIEAVKRLLVDRIFIDQKSNFRDRICYKNQCFQQFCFFDVWSKAKTKNTKFAFHSRIHIKSWHSERCPAGCVSLTNFPKPGISTFSCFRLFLKNDDVEKNDVLMHGKIVKQKHWFYSSFGKRTDIIQVRKSRFACDFDR